MLSEHKDLSRTLAQATKQAVAIENAGGNVQSVIHHLRSASQLVDLRVQAYADHAAEQKELAEAKAKAEAEANQSPKP